MTRVIIINEHGPIREVIFQLAASLETDIEISAFGDPHEALSDIRMQPPDLLIANGAIAGMNTDEFLRRFRDEPECQEVPAVIVTADDSAGLRSIAFKAGTTELLLAPIDHDEFRLRSRTLLSIHRARMTAGQGRNTEKDDRQSAVESEQARVEQIEMFNGLIQTLSAKLLAKINELDRLRGELKNVVDATAMPAIFVDDQLCVRHFTDEVVSIYGLGSQDVGRSLCGIKCALDYSDLDGDFRSVMQTGQPVERYLERRDGKAHFLMRISPNRSSCTTIWGAVITFAKMNAWYRGHA